MAFATWNVFGPSVSSVEIRDPHEATLQEIMLGLGPLTMHSRSASASPAKETLTLIKKSIKEIKAQPLSTQSEGRIENKINRLLDLGALAQATILDAELHLRHRLNRLQEWDYKVLPAAEIGRFESENKVTATRDGIRVHITPLEAYCGTAPDTETKDKIMPDNVLDELGKAQERKLFDKFSVLWLEKVKDPLLLGSIDGCEDYFLIAEWGDDVSFDDIMASEEKRG